MRKYDSFVISMCLEGDCEIRLRPTVTSGLSPLTSLRATLLPSGGRNPSPLILKAGHSTLIPAAIADYDVIPLHGKSKILDAFIDNQDNLGDKITKFLHIRA
jgi:mannose-6-phosphate isomerase